MKKILVKIIPENIFPFGKKGDMFARKVENFFEGLELEEAIIFLQIPPSTPLHIRDIIISRIVSYSTALLVDDMEPKRFYISSIHDGKVYPIFYPRFFFDIPHPNEKVINPEWDEEVEL